MRRILGTAALALLAGCTEDAPEDAPGISASAIDTALLSPETARLAGFTLVPVRRDAWRSTISGPARVALDPVNTEPIGSIVEGRVTKVYVMPGDRVQRGQVLVSIHSHEMMDARASLSKAQAGVAAARAQQRVATSAAERAARLYELKALALADLERARGGKDDADAAVATAEAELHRSEGMVEHLAGHDAMPADYDEHWVLIRSPMTGQVVTRQAEPGNVVLVGAPLLTVSRTSSLVLISNLPEQAVSGIRPGATVQFTTTATGTTPFSARVTRIFPAVDTLTRTIEVHAAINGAGTSALRPEMYATAEIMGQASAQTVIVPAAALQALDGDTVVFAAQSGSDGVRLEAVRVRVGRLTRDLAEILTGIDTGRTVVARGASIAKAELLKRRGGGE